jgi:hypothetical protein
MSDDEPPIDGALSEPICFRRRETPRQQPRCYELTTRAVWRTPALFLFQIRRAKRRENFAGVIGRPVAALGQGAIR